MISFKQFHANGFNKKALRLIQSYLSNRRQRAKVNLSFSSWEEFLFGVPQGSILGPLLYNIALRDLFFAMLFTILQVTPTTIHLMS